MIMKRMIKTNHDRVTCEIKAQKGKVSQEAVVSCEILDIRRHTGEIRWTQRWHKPNKSLAT